MKKLLFIIMLFISFTTFAQEKIDTEKVEITEAERIIDKYSDKIGDFIEATAESLKVPAEHVYTVLARQAYVDSFAFTFVLLFGLFSLFYGTKDAFNGKNYVGNSETPNSKATRGIIVTIIGAIMVFVGLIHIQLIMQGFVNPEYVAIEKILEILK